MADWRKLALSALLADGKIDDNRVAVLRKELLGEKRIDRAEMEFLIEAKKALRGPAPALDKLVAEAARYYVLADGKVMADEANWLRQFVMADGKADEADQKLLKEIKFLADQTGPEFQKLFQECVKG